MEYKNFDIQPGTTAKLRFDVLDANGLKVDLSSGATKFEVFDNNGIMVFSKVNTTTPELGVSEISLDTNDTKVFKDSIYDYRLILVKGQDTTTIYNGFLATAGDVPIFDFSSTAAGNSITLPDGTIYANSAVVLIPDTWYAISSSFRFLVSGICVLVIDGKDLHGTVWYNRSVYSSNVLNETRWIPDLEGMTAFRIKVASGSCTIRYLP